MKVVGFTLVGAALGIALAAGCVVAGPVILAGCVAPLAASEVTAVYIAGATIFATAGGAAAVV